MVDLQPVGEVAYTGSALVRVCDDDHFVAAVNQFLRTRQNARSVAGSIVKRQLTDDSW